MLSISSLSKSFDTNLILNKVSFNLTRGEVVGLVGKNGCGKSTLLKIIMGLESKDCGEITLASSLVAFLPQNLTFNQPTIENFLNEKALKNGVEYKVPRVLEDLGVNYLDLNQNPNTLSGGEKTRIYLASLFLEFDDPDILILDEPTNNLDIDGLYFLENFIKKFRGLVLLVSHDRYFLDKVATRILELESGVIKNYGGNYSFYKSTKEQEQLSVERNYVSQQKKMEKALLDINSYTNKALWGEKTFTSGNPYERKKAAKAAKQAVVRKKKVIKFLNSSDYIPKPKQFRSYFLPLKSSIPKSSLVLKVTNFSFKYLKKDILKNINFSAFGGEHIWVSGKNGSGKSTLFNVILNGSIKDTIYISPNVQFGFIPQNINLDLKDTGLSYLKENNISEFDAFKLANSLRLHSEDLRVPMISLSKGQQLKIEFIKLLLGNCNVLLLDEPTNHLEIETREDIERVLKDYAGTIIVCSHDRYFLDNIGIDRVLNIENTSIRA